MQQKDKPHNGTNMCKQRHPLGIYLQNTQTAYAPRYQRNNPVKWGTRFKWTFPHRKRRDGHEAHEKMFSICKY